MGRPIDTDTCALGPYRADLVETYWRWDQDPTPSSATDVRHPSPSKRAPKAWPTNSGAKYSLHHEPVPAGVATLLPDHTVRSVVYVTCSPKHADADAAPRPRA